MPTGSGSGSTVSVHAAGAVVAGARSVVEFDEQAERDVRRRIVAGRDRTVM
jgi:hypothetical protein